MNDHRWKYYFILVALIIVSGSVLYTNNLVNKLAREEAKKVELWAKGLRSLQTNQTQDVELVREILEQNETIPVILVDEEDDIIAHRNIKVPNQKGDKFLKQKLAEMKKYGNHTITISWVDGRNYIYFDDSKLLKRLAWYPFVQLGVIFTFIVILFVAYSYSKTAEQNKVWVGMSKETAHQLGTPISSLMAWMELMKMGAAAPEMTEEMEKDVARLQMIAERFSKIGSKPMLKQYNIAHVIESSIEYLKKRTSAKIVYQFINNVGNCDIPLNTELFSWVIENITKNAVDAMEGGGTLTYTLNLEKGRVIFDISDTGKGIAPNKQKAVFKPGYTSKKRGWGLGLSLAKRIIENYHKGKIFVLKSELKKGTTFRIILPAQI